MAIGIAGGMVIFAACLAIFVVVTVICLLAWIPFAMRAVGAGMRESAPQFKSALGAALEEGHRRAALARERGLARNERQRQWLLRHRVLPRLARMLTRSMAG